ncbi:hypothetical protein PGT21_030828 [Puccinia graminis f. sp. tritici]|uniref:Uncharacterized protein n=1 Tax=Puccinia graminis f. sp. tritici TaxID=56615 RepID=A0A5B0MNY9_PUCGR|nr:hypothetical protein PGT21_030828 [Puccinia graminis f. sp. tritici]KAA1078551.1 hypothetical protein PGTUg99_012192 [Puccinia graminis f. sp. tritici]
MFRGLSNQADSDYERRIRHLEEVVCHLLANRQHPAPVTGSFRYSIKRGLEPVLSSKTTLSLTADWQPGRSGRMKRPCSSSWRRSQPLVTRTASPSLVTSLEQTALKAEKDITSASNPASPTTTGDADIADAAKISPIANPASSATSKPPTQQSQAIVNLSSEIDCDQAKLGVSSKHPARLSTSSLKQTRLPSPLILLKAPTFRSRSLDRLPTFDCPASGKVNCNHTKPEIKPSTGDPRSLCSTTPSSISPNHCLSSEGNQNELNKNNDSDLTTNLTTPIPTDATPDCPTSKSKHSNHILADDSLIKSLPPNPHTFIPPPASMQENLAQAPVNSDVETLYLPSPLPPVDLTPVPACPINLEVAAIGSLTVENDNSNSTDAQPSDTLNTPEHLLPSLPVDVPAAAIGALMVMDDEALAALKRQDDPRYRPIEDSEFVLFEDW